MHWLRQRKQWISLWVVLYDLTVSEYTWHYNRSLEGLQDLPNLPGLGSSVTMMEWSSNQYRSRRELCLRLKGDIINHDEDGALMKWVTALSAWDSLTKAGFPLASSLFLYPTPQLQHGETAEEGEHRTLPDEREAVTYVPQLNKVHSHVPRHSDIESMVEYSVWN